MKSIRALIVDDLERSRKELPGRFDYDFAQLGWEVTWDRAESVHKARQLLATGGANYNLIFVDLLFKRFAQSNLFEPVGLDLIVEARAKHPGAFILAVSGGDPSRWPNLFDDAGQRGANRVLRRSEFAVDAPNNSPKAIVTAVNDFLLDTGSFVTTAVAYDQHDPGISSLVHEVGDTALARLYCLILESKRRTTGRVELGFIAPGASGAAVCTVEADIDMPKARLRSVLKLSRSRQHLLEEAERGALAASLLRPGLIVRLEPDHPVGPVNGWYALASQLDREATTLRAWLVGNPDASSVEDVLGVLFTDGLGAVHADNCADAADAAKLLELPPHRRYLILHALDELSPLLTHEEGFALPDDTRLTADLRTFVEDGRISLVRARQSSQPTCSLYAHGDLHGANILVYGGRRATPTMIDASRFGLAHWAVDPARLAVDLLMRSVDPGPASMFFTGFRTWRILAQQVGRLEPVGPAVTADGGTPAALAALTWLGANLRGFTPRMADPEEYRKHRWEWHLALASYLLRATYNTDVTAPKRAFALVAAHEQLLAAADVVPA